MKNTLKVQRAIHDLTQAELAEKVDVSVWTINMLEKNKYNPSYALVSRIANFFKVRVDEIFVWEEGDGS